MTQPAAGPRNDTLTDLLGRAIGLGIDAVRVARRSMPSLDQLQLQVPRIDLGQVPMPSMTAPCDVPPPCWWPRSAGEVTSVVCEGASPVLRLRITNCGPTPREFAIKVPEGVGADPPTLSLGPMERAEVTLRREGAGEALVWVLGCYEHFVRWTVQTSRRGPSSSCHEVEVEDCPDHRHHWYDHFYCNRPCPADAPR